MHVQCCCNLNWHVHHKGVACATQAAEQGGCNALSGLTQNRGRETMSRATTEPTTLELRLAPPPAPNPQPCTSRRRLLTGLAGATVAATTLAAIAPSGAPAAESADAELIAACARFEALEAAYRASCDSDVNADLRCPEGYDEALQAVEDTPARTFAGMRAKARAIIAYHQPDYLGSDYLIWSLVEDVAGEHGA